MTLVRFKPIREFDNINNSIQKYFDDFATTWPWGLFVTAGRGFIRHMFCICLSVTFCEIMLFILNVCICIYEGWHLGHIHTL